MIIAMATRRHLRLQSLGLKRESTDTQNAIALGLALAALGNLMGLVDPPSEPPRYWSASGAVLCAGALLHTVWPLVDSSKLRGGGRAEVLRRLADTGLTSRHLKRSLAAGACVGLALGAPGLVLLVLPEDSLPVLQGIRPMALRPAMGFIFGQLLVSTAASEELVFRGVLQHKLSVGLQPRHAVLLSSLFFALWHGVFNARTLAAMGVNGKLRFGLVSILQLVSVYLGGLAFGMLREYSGNLAGTIVAHWITDILLNARFLVKARAGKSVAASAGLL